MTHLAKGTSWLESPRLDALLPAALRGVQTLEAYRARLLALASLVLGLAGPAVATGYARQGELGYAAIFAGAVLLQLLAFALMRWRGWVVASAHLSCLVLWTATCTGIYATGGLASAATRWLVLIPIIAAIFAGARAAGLWLFVSVLSVAFMALAPSLGITLPPALAVAHDPTHQAVSLITYMSVALALFLISELLRVWLVRQAKASDMRADTILEVAPEGVIILDERGQLQRVNPAAAALLRAGLTQARLLAATERLDEHGRALLELPPLALELTSTPMSPDCPDGPKLVSLHDVTHERALRAQLQEALDNAIAASQAKSRFLAMMSHELRTPLNAIIGYGELLQEELEADGIHDYHDETEAIRVAGQHLLTLISDILDLSRIEAGRLSLQLEHIPLKTLFTQLHQTATLAIEKNHNAFLVELPDELASLTLYTDAPKLRQLLLNLLTNAAKFTHRGHVHLRAQRLDAQRLSLIVQDTGIGMTPEQQARVWDEFVQADSSTTRRYGGSGLGLALVRRLTQLLGGSIRMESVPHQGTTFELTLPLRSDSPRHVTA